MLINTTSDLELSRRFIREAEAIFAFMTALVDENENLELPRLQDRLNQAAHHIIDFRCALESAFMVRGEAE